jgi:hypothetical protein
MSSEFPPDSFMGDVTSRKTVDLTIEWRHIYALGGFGIAALNIA